jgi:hypothetical protein
MISNFINRYLKKKSIIYIDNTNDIIESIHNYKKLSQEQLLYIKNLPNKNLIELINMYDSSINNIIQNYNIPNNLIYYTIVQNIHNCIKLSNEEILFIKHLPNKNLFELIKIYDIDMQKLMGIIKLIPSNWLSKY